MLIFVHQMHGVTHLGGNNKCVLIYIYAILPSPLQRALAFTCTTFADEQSNANSPTVTALKANLHLELQYIC